MDTWRFSAFVGIFMKVDGFSFGKGFLFLTYFYVYYISRDYMRNKYDHIADFPDRLSFGACIDDLNILVDREVTFLPAHSFRIEVQKYDYQINAKFVKTD